MAQQQTSVTYNTREAVDFVIVGSGAAGGVIAKELSSAGFSVVVLEQGPHLKAGDFRTNGAMTTTEALYGAVNKDIPRRLGSLRLTQQSRQRQRLVMRIMSVAVVFIFQGTFGAYGPSISKRLACAER